MMVYVAGFGLCGGWVICAMIVPYDSGFCSCLVFDDCCCMLLYV